MGTSIESYLQALKNYAGEVRVPGLDVASKPLPLADVFVEPQLQSEDSEPSGLSAQSALGRSLITNVGALRREARRQAPPEPASRALVRQQRMVILGEPGQGKSTLLRQYAAYLAAKSPNQRLPLLIELGRKREKTKLVGCDYHFLHDRLPDTLRQALGDDGWAACCEAIQSSKAAVLLDGLDELTAEAQQQVLEVAGTETLKKNQVVLTSRPHVYRLAPLGGFQVCRLRELEPRQIKRLAENVCRALAPQFGVDDERARTKVLEVARGPAAQMARNPLFLSFMCLTAVRRQAEQKLEDFPARPVPLIGECVGALVEWHRKHKVPRTWPENLDRATVVRMLAPLALQSFEDGSGVIEQEALQELGDKERSYFEHLVAARFVEETNSHYRFPLEPFRQYLAARAAAAKADPFATVKYHLHQPEWERMVVYTAGCLKPVRASRLTLALPTFTWLFVKAVGPLLRLGASLLGLAGAKKPVEDAAKEAIKELGPLLQGPLERWLMRSRRSAEFFITAVWKFRWRWHRYDRILERDLRLAARCAGGLAQCPKNLAEGLVDSLVGKRRLIYLSAEALREAARCPQVQQRLLELTDSPVGKRRLRLIHLIPEVWQVVIRTPQMERTLLELWGGNALECMAAAVGLVVAALVWLDKDVWVRVAVAGALAGAAAEPQVQQRLLELTRYKNQAVREAAARALAGAAAEPSVQQRLQEKVGHAKGGDMDPRVCIAAAQALAAAAAESPAQQRLLELVWRGISLNAWRLRRCWRERLLISRCSSACWS